MDQAWTALGGTPVEKRLVSAALGPLMSWLAAERKPVIFLFNIAPGQVGLSKKVLGGAGAIVCEQTVCLCEDPVTARKAASGALASYMGLPNYYKNWFRLGFNEGDLEDGGSDRLTDTMVI